MELSREQRWILANQYRILERLDPDEAEYHARAREVLESGFELNYDWIAEHVSEQTVLADKCKEVLDILNMFSALERSYDQLADKGDIGEHAVRFRGFYGNEETDQLSYARFLIERGQVAGAGGPRRPPGQPHAGSRLVPSHAPRVAGAADGAEVRIVG